MFNGLSWHSRIWVFLVVACAGYWAAMRAPALAAATSGYTNPQLLIETEELGRRLGETGLRIVDTRSKEEYAKGHIPGALNLRWQALDDLEANKQGLPIAVSKAEELFSGLGIGGDTAVVAYDGPKNPFGAARLFYVLEFFGHSKVRVLNGGFAKWEQERRTISTAVPAPARAVFVARPRPELSATAEQVRTALGEPTVCLLDARSGDEYSGKDVRASRAGRIPGAVNVDYLQTIRPEDHTFRSAEELQKIFAAKGVTPDRETITYCHTGGRAAHDYFVLRLLGYQRLRNYDGSWAEWGNSDTLPVEE
ncbi:MAG: sulfurtransferase [Candidatus Methylomirabilaceae bacterium]